MKQFSQNRTVSVFDEPQQCYRNLSLFPADRELPADAVDSMQIRLSGRSCAVPHRSEITGWPASFGISWPYKSSGARGWEQTAKR